MRVRVWAQTAAHGGAGGYARSLVDGLRRRGHVVVLGGQRRAGEVVVSLERREGADVWRAGGGVHRVAVAREGRLRSWFDREWRREQAAARTARVVVANSELVAHQLVRELGVPARRIALIRTGVDLERFRPLRDGARERHGRRVLFAAHGWRRKGFRVAVEAFARVARPGDVLWVAGRDGRRLRRLTVARLHLSACTGVSLVDLGRRPDLAAVLPHVDAVVHPTRYDAAANLVLESLAAGVPIVTSRWDGSAEILPDPALVVQDPTNAEQVAASLVHALERAGETAVWRAAAECWPDSRNHDQMDAVVRRPRTTNG
jgi:UDP-glucose:(heptosyl)LPS alpha-1,3-glucosyltransferase